jgi:hypothetical protein
MGNTVVKKTIHRDKNHSHYWIENGELFESYQTIRGLRFRHLIAVDLPNNDKCDESIIRYIEAEYLNF